MPENLSIAFFKLSGTEKKNVLRKLIIKRAKAYGREGQGRGCNQELLPRAATNVSPLTITGCVDM